MKNLDDGPDGLNDAAYDRALRLMGVDKSKSDVLCAQGGAKLVDGVWKCDGCGRSFKRSPNQHIYAARKRIRGGQ